MKIGDRVRIKRPGDRYHGKTGEIIRVNERLGISHVQMSTGRPQPFSDKDLEILKEAPKQKTFTIQQSKYPKGKCPKCGSNLGVKLSNPACHKCKIRQNNDASGDLIDSWSPFSDFI